MSISQRTTKLILATCLACLLAYFLNLSSAVSAGIIALLRAYLIRVEVL